MCQNLLCAQTGYGGEFEWIVTLQGAHSLLGRQDTSRESHVRPYIQGQCWQKREEEGREALSPLPEAITKNKDPSFWCQVAAVLPGECRVPWGCLCSRPWLHLTLPNESFPAQTSKELARPANRHTQTHAQEVEWTAGQIIFVFPSPPPRSNQWHSFLA